MGATPLHLAAIDGRLEVMKMFVEAGANIMARAADGGGATPLHIASSHGQVEAVKLLVKAGADIKARTLREGVTPLHIAASEGRVETVKTLVHLGAQLSARTVGGETPLQTSIRCGHRELEQVLRRLERAARTPKATKATATRRGAQPTTREDTLEAREAAERMAALLMEEEEEDLAKAGTPSQVSVCGSAVGCV